MRVPKLYDPISTRVLRAERHIIIVANEFSANFFERITTRANRVFHRCGAKLRFVKSQTMYRYIIVKYT